MSGVVTPWFRHGQVTPHLKVDMLPYQFYQVAPPGMVVVLTTWDLAEYGLAAVEAELPAIWRGVDLIAKSRVDRIDITGVPVAAALGRPRMLAILDEARVRTGQVCGNTLEAHIAALDHLGAKRVALGTRWPEALNEDVSRYLDEAGFPVVGCESHSRNLAQNLAADAADDHELLLGLGRRTFAAAPDADALLLPGGAGYVIHAAAMLEEEFGKPVLTNQTSTVWAALHDRGGNLVHRPDPRWSKLFSTL